MADMPTIVVLGFETVYAKKDGQMVERDRVRYAPRHDPNVITSEFVSALKPPENGIERDDEGLKMGYMDALWRQIEPAYKAWKEGVEVPAHGIPLSAWAGVTSVQAEAFRRSGIKTVEDVAEMTESQMNKVQLPGVRGFKTTAAAYLASRETTETAEKVATLQEQNEAMKAQLEHMAAMIASMRDGTDAPDAPKRRGRPPKSEVEEAA